MCFDVASGLCNPLGYILQLDPSSSLDGLSVFGVREHEINMMPTLQENQTVRKTGIALRGTKPINRRLRGEILGLALSVDAVCRQCFT